MNRTTEYKSDDPFKELAIDTLKAIEAIGKNISTEKEPSLLCFKQACQFLNVKDSKLRKMIFEKTLPYKKLGRNIRFSIVDLKEWLEENTVK